MFLPSLVFTEAEFGVAPHLLLSSLLRQDAVLQFKHAIRETFLQRFSVANCNY